MLVLGGIIGFALSFALIAVPVAANMAGAIGTVLLPTLPVPVWNIGVGVGALLHAIVSLICYVVAAVAVATSGAVPAAGAVPRTPAGGTLAGWEHVELFARGLMIGTNAPINFVVLPYLPAWLALQFGLTGVAAFWILAIPSLWVLSTIVLIANVLCLDEGACGDPFFEAVLGYLTWVMPTAFVINVIGLIFVIIDIVSFFFGVPLRFAFEWWIGVVTVHGGVVHPTLFGGIPTAYNTGLFIFVHPIFRETTPIDIPGVTAFWTADGLLFHESGHTMNVAAFGSWWHLVGAIDEAIQGTAAFAEMLAESHMHDSTAQWFPLWGVPGSFGATTANTPATFTTFTIGDGTTTGTIFPAGTLLALTAAGPTDPDGFPLSLADPGVNPLFGTLWAVTPAGPGTQTFTLPTPNANPGALTPATGGDYNVRFMISDGMEGIAGIATLNVVEARPNGPYTGTAGTPVPVFATGSTAGTAGVLPSVATPGTPLLTLAWTLVSGPTPAATGSFDNPAAETPNFTGDTAGVYTISLQAAESGGVAHAATTTITLS